MLVAGGTGGAALGSAELYDPISNTWSAAGSLGVTRAAHTATLLTNGKVLVTGGFNGSFHASAELYDPATNTWAPAASLTTARQIHTATLLSNGKVLLAGGQNAGGSVSAGELYNPGTDTWSAAGSLAAARYSHSGGLLPNGKVLVVGGVDAVQLSSAEIYDPGANAWFPAASLSSGRRNISLSLLPNGTLIAAGGFNGSGSVASVDRYNLSSNTWSLTGAMSVPRETHTATLLPSGKVLIVGGGNAGGVLTSAELYDPGAASWTLTANLLQARSEHTATLLDNGKVLAAGGLNGGNSAELYNPGTNTWSVACPFAAPRYEHTATLLPNGKVLIAGGIGGAGPISSAELYDPGSDTWSAAGNLAAPRAFHTATLLPDGKVLVAGGSDAVSLGSAELYDPVANTWSAAASMNGARARHSATLLANGLLLAAGGVDGVFLSSAELYDPVLNTWTVAGSMAVLRGQHKAILLMNGRVLVVAGFDGTNALNSAELYDSGTDAWTPAGSLTDIRIAHTATLLPDGKVLAVAGFSGSNLFSAELYDPATNAWSMSSKLNMARIDHSATLLTNGKLLVTGGYDGAFIYTSELYDAGVQFQPAWKPIISTANPPVILTGGLLLTGTGFTGIAEASDGGSASSASNYPLVQLRSLVNGQTEFLFSNPTHPWSDTTFKSTSLTQFFPGPAQVTVFVNGIPSDSTLVQLIGNTAPVIAEHNPYETAMAEDGSPTPFNVTLNASDLDGNTIAWVISSPASKGMASVSGTGPSKVISYVPNADSNGGDSFMVQVSDGFGGFDSVTINVAVAPVNDPPVNTVPPGITGAPSSGQMVAAANGTWNDLKDQSPGTTVITYTYQWQLADDAAGSNVADIPGATAASYTPTPAQNQKFLSVKVTATDNGMPATASTTLPSPYVQIGNSPPVITQGAGPVAVTMNEAGGGTPFSLTLDATDVDGNPITWSISTAAGHGAASVSGTGASMTINYVPAAHYVGADTFTVQVSDGLGGIDSIVVNVNILVANPITITSPLAISGLVGDLLLYLPLGTGPGVITFTTSVLPPGLAFDGQNISGVPTQAGVYNVSLTASNGVSADVTQTLVIVIANEPLSYSGTTAFKLKVGMGFSQDLSVANENIVTFSVTGLPSGLNLAGSTIAGTPTREGLFAATLTGSAADGSSLSANLSFEVLARNANLPPELSEIFLDPETPFIGETVLFAVSASDPENSPVTTSWSFGDGVEASGEEVTHIYTAAGNYTLTVTATDVTDASIRALLVPVTVSDPRQPSIFAVTIASSPATPNQSVTFAAEAADPNGETLTYSWNFGDGTPLSASASPTHAYTSEGVFVVAVTVRNTTGILSREFKTSMFVVTPGGAPNINTGVTTVNPLNGLSQTVTFSDDGVLRLTISGQTLSGATMSRAQLRATNDLDTNFGIAGRGPVKGDSPVVKIPKPGIFVATSTARDRLTKVKKGKTRKTLPVSRKELGLAPLVTAEPQDTSISKVKLSGNFLLGRTGGAEALVSDPDAPKKTVLKIDNLGVRGSIEMPAGLDMSIPQEVQVAFGNIVDKVVVDTKGRGAGKFTKLTIRPKMQKKTKLTAGGTIAKFALSMSVADMVANGFDTEGVSATPHSPDLAIQSALMIGGVVYAVQHPVRLNVANDGESASISSRKEP